MPQTYIPHTQTTTELPANPGPTVGGPSNRSSHRPLPHSDSSQGPPTQAPPRTSVLSHFARANHLAALKALADSFQCIVPGEVVSELMVGVTDYPAIGDAIGLDWVELVTLEDLEVVLEFAQVQGGVWWRSN